MVVGRISLLKLMGRTICSSNQMLKIKKVLMQHCRVHNSKLSHISPFDVNLPNLKSMDYVDSHLCLLMI